MRITLGGLLMAAMLAGCASEPVPVTVEEAAPPGKAEPDAPPRVEVAAADPAAGAPAMTDWRLAAAEGGMVDVNRGRASAGSWALSVLGTPFLWVFKTAACGATLVIAAPTAAFFALTPDHQYNAGMAVLGEGVSANCGPPYLLSPYS